MKGKVINNLIKSCLFSDPDCSEYYLYIGQNEYLAKTL